MAPFVEVCSTRNHYCLILALVRFLLTGELSRPLLELNQIKLGDDANSKEVLRNLSWQLPVCLGYNRDQELQNVEEDSSLDDQKQKSRSQFKKRVIFGLGIGLSVGGIAQGMTPPPRYLSRVCSVYMSALMPILTFSLCGLTAPVLNTGIGRSWPTILGGQAHWTVGLVAILISFCGIIASDTFAFLGGKAFGKTPLISISPKKTWEGALAGLVGCITITILLSKSLSWPQSSSAFGVLNFFGSVFGDLTESMIKRDAGVKDSGSLIPGHGGILDRVDSYIFTGALAYSFYCMITLHQGECHHLLHAFIEDIVWWARIKRDYIGTGIPQNVLHDEHDDSDKALAIANDVWVWETLFDGGEPLGPYVTDSEEESSHGAKRFKTDADSDDKYPNVTDTDSEEESSHDAKRLGTDTDSKKCIKQ
ncbi:unnamed protein product [Arabidopsis arenosa]|uniref:Phosphatidate cytidylyltransferase n=1 Tax=Arabidopsis arenosa TaxID=38785 RepID=A0A8S2APL5_ARAAE|nr:unnamed protein product [Arabidopsis arenosa]